MLSRWLIQKKRNINNSKNIVSEFDTENIDVWMVLNFWERLGSGSKKCFKA